MFEISLLYWRRLLRAKRLLWSKVIIFPFLPWRARFFYFVSFASRKYLFNIFYIHRKYLCAYPEFYVNLKILFCKLCLSYFNLQYSLRLILGDQHFNTHVLVRYMFYNLEILFMFLLFYYIYYILLYFFHISSIFFRNILRCYTSSNCSQIID